MNNDGGISIRGILVVEMVGILASANILSWVTLQHIFTKREILMMAAATTTIIVAIILKMNSVSGFGQSFCVKWIVYDAHTGKVPHFYFNAITFARKY